MPDMAIDHLGRAHVVWRGSDFFVWYAQVGADGAVAIPARKVFENTKTAFPRIAVDAAGDAHIVTATTRVDSSLVYLKVSNGQRVLLNVFGMFTPGVWDSEADYSPTIDINPLTNLPVIAAEVQLSTSYWIGGWPVYRYNQEVSVVALDAAGAPIRSSRWSAYYSRNNPAPVYQAQYPEVAVDSLGITHLVWWHSDPDWSGQTVGYARQGAEAWTEIANTRNAAGLAGKPRIIRGDPGFVEIVWSTSTGEAVWQEMDTFGLTAVDDTVVSQATGQASRPRTAWRDGNVFFGWADAREGNGTQIYARSLLNPAVEQNVTCSPVSVGNHALAARSTNSVALVWQDTRNGLAQVFYRATAFLLKGQIRFWDRTPIQNVQVLLMDTNRQVVAQALSTNDGSYRIDLTQVTKPGSYYLKARTQDSKASHFGQNTAWPKDQAWPSSDGEAENWFTDGKPGPHAWADYADPYARPDLEFGASSSGTLEVVGGDAQEAYQRGQADICFPQPIVWVHGIYADTRRFYPQYGFFSDPNDVTNSWTGAATNRPPRRNGVVDLALSYFVGGLHTEDPKKLGHLLQSNLTCDENAGRMEDFMRSIYDAGMRVLVADYDRGAGSRPAINLVCHSMGAPISRIWLCRSNADDQHGRVTNYVSIAGIHGGNYAASLYTYRVPLSVLTRDRSAQSCAVRYVHEVNNNDGLNAYWGGVRGNLYFAWGENGRFARGWKAPLGFIWRELEPHDGVNNSPSATSQNGPYRAWQFRLGPLRIDLSDLFRADLNLDLRTTRFGQHVREVWASREPGAGSLAKSMLAKVDLATVQRADKEGFGDHSFMDSGRGCMASYAVWLGLASDPAIPKRYGGTDQFARWPDDHYVPMPGEGGVRLQGAPGSLGEGDALVASATETVTGPGWSKVYRIPVDACAEVQVAVEWHADCVLNVQLRDPSGQLVAPVPVDVEEEPDGVQPTAQFYVASSPAVGLWTLFVEAGAGVPAEGAPLMVGVVERTDLQFVGRLTPDAVRPGEPVTIQAAVARGDQVLALPLEVEGRVTGPAGEVALLTLHDDGQHGDVDAGDGLYGAEWGDTAVSGEYTFDLVTRGTSDRGETFQRTGLAVLQVMSAKARFTGTASERAVDRNGNGRYDDLVVSVGLTAKEAGGFVVSGRLVSEAGQILAVASWQGQLASGSQTVDLSFSGRSIGNSLTDGPYQVGGLSLAEVGGAKVRGVGVGRTLACDEWAKALNTRKYGYSEFEGDRVGSPKLRVQLSGGRLTLAWPAGASGYVLEETPSLSLPMQWSAVTNSPSGDANETKVDLLLSPNVAFYRLRKP